MNRSIGSIVRSALYEDLDRLDAVVGKHVYANLYFLDREPPTDTEELKEIVKKAAEVANTTPYDVFGMKSDYMVSAVCLVLESHIAIHIYPHARYGTVDVYTCGAKSDPWKAFEYILQRLKPSIYVVNYTDRSSTPLKT